MSVPRTLRLGTRGSELALWQANHVRDALLRRHEHALAVELVIVKTEGDRVIDRPLHEIGGKGVFVKDLEARLLCGEIDLAVHSMKDLPSIVPDGLVIGATPPREDARDVLVGLEARSLRELPPGARVGTGSSRRAALARRLNPGIDVVPIRGNVPTRVAKVMPRDLGGLDAVILAAAGLVRLGLAGRITEYLAPDDFCPSPCQGILALECRGDDDWVRDCVGALSDDTAAVCSAAERAFLRVLGVGCMIPVGCHATTHRDQVRVHGVIVAESGEPCFEGVVQGERSAADRLGRELAERLLAEGAQRILPSAGT